MLTFVVQSHRGVEQLVARRAHNPEAGGSSPSPATKQAKNQSLDWFFCVYSCCLLQSLKACSANGSRLCSGNDDKNCLNSSSLYTQKKSRIDVIKKDSFRNKI